MLAGNSKRLWKINQFLFVNTCFPTTYHHSITILMSIAIGCFYTTEIKHIVCFL